MEGFTRWCHGHSADSGEMGAGGGTRGDQKADRRGTESAKREAGRSAGREQQTKVRRSGRTDCHGGRPEDLPAPEAAPEAGCESRRSDRLDTRHRSQQPTPQRSRFPLRERPGSNRRRHYGATLARVKQFFAHVQVFSAPAGFRGRDARIAVTLRSIDRERIVACAGQVGQARQPSANLSPQANLQPCASWARHHASFSAVVVGRAPSVEGFFAAAAGLGIGA
ncbi:MAG: hypothetical protein RLZZ326_2638 [Planctomycetota bacterium]